MVTRYQNSIKISFLSFYVVFLKIHKENSLCLQKFSSQFPLRTGKITDLLHQTNV